MVTVYAANGEEIMFDPDQSEVSVYDNVPGLSQTRRLSLADTSEGPLSI